MEATTTRIADLPENITMQMNGQGFNTNSYAPMNIHPNPYGNGPATQTAPMSHPQASAQRVNPNNQPVMVQQNQFLPQPQPEMPQQEHRLPSRDIPIETTHYSQDAETTPNYIPPVKLTSDYIREYENTSEKRLKEHEQEKYRENKAKDLFSEFQTPILIILLYFFFQLPAVNTFLYKNLSFLSTYNSDGNANIYGMLMKSVLFGSVFFSINTSVKYLSEL